MNSKAIILIISLIAISTGGCSKSIFDNQDARCPFVERGGCQSMYEINRMVSQNRYTPDGAYVQQNEQYLPRCTNKSKCRRKG